MGHFDVTCAAAWDIEGQYGAERRRANAPRHHETRPSASHEQDRFAYRALRKPLGFRNLGLHSINTWVVSLYVSRFARIPLFAHPAHINPPAVHWPSHLSDKSETFGQAVPRAVP